VARFQEFLVINGIANLAALKSDEDRKGFVAAFAEQILWDRFDLKTSTCRGLISKVKISRRKVGIMLRREIQSSAGQGVA
jgi:hypothetical protein